MYVVGDVYVSVVCDVYVSVVCDVYVSVWLVVSVMWCACLCVCA